MAETSFKNLKWGERPDMVAALTEIGNTLDEAETLDSNDQVIVLEALLAAAYIGRFKKRVSAETFAWGVKTNIENFINDTGL